jgi:hypothetical protein
MRALPLAAALALSLSVPALAQSTPPNLGCSNATLNGEYLNGGVLGTIFPPAFGVTEASASAVAGFSVYNGHGTGADFVTFTVNGSVIPVPESQATKYNIKADCTGTKEVNGGPTFNIYVAPDGSAFTEVATGAPIAPGSSTLVPGFVVSARSTRVVNFSENQQ